VEFRKFKQMLRNYYEHIREHPESLINRIYGMHLIKWKSTKGQKFKKFLVVMNNIFQDISVGDRFDLKGSTQGRRTLKDKAEYYSSTRNHKVALKDLDFRDYVG